MLLYGWQPVFPAEVPVDVPVSLFFRGGLLKKVYLFTQNVKQTTSRPSLPAHLSSSHSALCWAAWLSSLLPTLEHCSALHIACSKLFTFLSFQLTKIILHDDAKSCEKALKVRTQKLDKWHQRAKTHKGRPMENGSLKNTKVWTTKFGIRSYLLIWERGRRGRKTSLDHT